MISARQKTRQTRIVCTLGRLHGPSQPEMATAFFDAGMNVARLNMSHCDEDYAKEAEVLNWVHGLGLPDRGPRLATLGDLQGPKIRLGFVAKEHATLPTGESIVLRGSTHSDDEAVLPIAPPLADHVFQGIALALAEGHGPIAMTLGDGDAILAVDSVQDGEAVARVVEGGPVRSRMGFTARGVAMDIEMFTDKDRRDLKFLMEHNVTYVGVSFVKSAEDLRRIRCYIRDTLGISRHVPLIAKIETADAVYNIQSILEKSEGVMVARGDLGLHIDIEEVPQVQKRIVELGRMAAKPVIIATQMLESMTRNPEPTRAEVTDVFNAIVDGCDAVMLSGETSYGDHPLKAIEVMGRIASRAELWRDSQRSDAQARQLLDGLYERFPDFASHEMNRLNDEIALAVHKLADGVGAEAIATITTTGASTRRVARFRSRVPIIAAGEDVDIMRQLILTHGTHPIVMASDEGTPFEERVKQLSERLQSLALVRSGDIVILTGGQTPWPKGSTNLLKVHLVD